MRDWLEWHRGYDDPSSAISARLGRVRLHLAEAISEAPPGQVGILSLCAGQGHDVIGVLPGHPRRNEVRALLIEADGRNAAIARDRAAKAGLSGVRVREADAADPASFADALPADVLLLCGIFGNVSDSDIRRTVGAAPALCADGATVLWTRHRRPPDLTPSIRSWFAAGGFDEVAFDALDTGTLTGLGVHRLVTRPPGRDLPAGRLFSFRGPAYRRARRGPGGLRSGPSSTTISSSYRAVVYPQLVIMVVDARSQGVSACTARTAATRTAGSSTAGPPTTGRRSGGAGRARNAAGGSPPRRP